MVFDDVRGNTPNDTLCIIHYSVEFYKVFLFYRAIFLQIVQLSFLARKITYLSINFSHVILHFLFGLHVSLSAAVQLVFLRQNAEAILKHRISYGILK